LTASQILTEQSTRERVISFLISEKIFDLVLKCAGDYINQC